MKRFEYVVDTITSAAEFWGPDQESQLLKKRGKEGWELVTVHTAFRSTKFYFKREVRK